MATGSIGTMRGDASDQFAFSEFFPEPLSAPVSVFANAVFQILVTLRICLPFSPTEIELGNARAEARGEGLTLSDGSIGRSGRPLPGSARAEAERRRALALKALDQRLHSSNHSRPSTSQVVQTAPMSTNGPSKGSISTPSSASLSHIPKEHSQMKQAVNEAANE